MLYSKLIKKNPKLICRFIQWQDKCSLFIFMLAWCGIYIAPFSLLHSGFFVFFWRFVFAMGAAAVVGAFFYMLEENKLSQKVKKHKDGEEGQQIVYITINNIILRLYNEYTIKKF